MWLLRITLPKFAKTNKKPLTHWLAGANLNLNVKEAFFLEFIGWLFLKKEISASRTAQPGKQDQNHAANYSGKGGEAL